MTTISISQEANLHRETYIALLSSQLKQPGAKTQLAERADIAPGYLSYILAFERDPYVSTNYPTMRTPSPKAAQRIVNALIAPKDFKQDILKHMILASEKRLLADRTIKANILNRNFRSDVISNTYQIYRQADKATQPEISKRLRRDALGTASTILKYLSPQETPLDYAKLCHLVYLIQVVHNRLGDSLWHAKLGRTVLENVYVGNHISEGQRIDSFLTQLIIDEGHSYHLLRQPKLAMEFFEKAQETKAFKQKREEWIPRLIDKRMSTIYSFSRFSITEIDNLADRGLELYEYRASENFYPIFSISLHRIRAHLLHKNFKKAKKFLNSELDRINDLTPKIGIGNAIRLFLTAAYFYSLQNDAEGWKHYIEIAYISASEGNYELQKIKIEAAIERFQKKQVRRN